MSKKTKKEVPKKIIQENESLRAAPKGRFKIKIKFTKKLKLFLFLLGLILAALLWLFWGIPLPTQITSSQPVSTKLFDRNGKLLYEIYSDERRTPVETNNLPSYVVDATIAIEDKDFYKHHGFSLTGMARAFYKNLFKGKLEGGSTLTQQLVKNTLLTPERTIRRKIREFALSMIVEMIYSKKQILDLYLNQIPYGSTAYGIGAASELYFGKNAYDLTLAEASLLAGLPAAPSRYSPYGSHPELAKDRQKLVLSQMVSEGYISQEEADVAFEEELNYSSFTSFAAPHFSLWVKEQLAEKYGEKMVEQGGLRVTTTLDLSLQEYAQEVVKKEVSELADQNVGNGAVIVTRPKSGEILAMVGSKDYFASDEDGKVNIIFAKRQPGSSIKPLNYALALRDGKITASTAIADIPTCFSVTGQEAYCPKNYDGEAHGLVQARFALGNSYNVPAVKILYLNGISNFVNFASSMGITTFSDPSNYGLSLTLGGGEVMPFDMATAFGVFANQGVKKTLISVLKIEDYQGKVLFEVDPDEREGDRIIDPSVTYIISHILYDNNARVNAFGERSFLNVSGHPEVSVKTGTTNDLRDNWTIGYTSHILVASWVGNNDNSPMRGAVSGVSGASPIWNEIMEFALDRAEEGNYSKEDGGHAWPLIPDGVFGTNICWTTGGLPETDPGCPTRFEYFLSDYPPSTALVERRDIQINKADGSIAGSEILPEMIETQNHPVYFDPLSAMYCLDCPISKDFVYHRYQGQ